MSIIALDPGTLQTGYAIMNGLDVIEHGIVGNREILDLLFTVQNSTRLSDPRFCDQMAYEMIASLGMPVGAEVFDTCVWIGRFVERFDGTSTPVFRRDVKSALCNANNATDSNVRQAILDLYPRVGGGKTPQVGTSKQPGPLYGVKSHVFAAIGVGLYAQGIIKR